MFTRNWYKSIASLMLRKSPGNFKNINNEEQRIGINTNISIGSAGSGDVCTPYMKQLLTSVSGGGGVIIGTGTTPPTLDDYYLSGDLITGFNFSYSSTIESDDNGSTITALYTITNSGDTAFTIGEIGLIANLYSSSYSGSKYNGLLERTVLDTPVTIEPGGVGQVTYTITFTYPTA